LKIKSTRLLQL